MLVGKAKVMFGSIGGGVQEGARTKTCLGLAPPK